MADKNYDMLIGDVTITKERLKIVDFSVPLESQNMIVFMKNINEKQHQIFSFLLPFSNTVWMAVLICLLVGKAKFIF